MQAEEDKVHHMEKVRQKLESQMDDLEDTIEREKRSRQDLEKSKRKVEGELKVRYLLVLENTGCEKILLHPFSNLRIQNNEITLEIFWKSKICLFSGRSGEHR